MKVIFPVKQYQKLQAYVNAVTTEISGLGKIRRVNDNFLVEELAILDQVVTDGFTMLTKHAYGNFMDEKMVAGEDLSAWKLWWHSHGTVHDAYFSATDQATIKDADNETDRQNWLLSLVTDSKGAIRIRLDIFYPTHVIVDNVPLEISFKDPEIESAIEQEVRQKVKQRGKEKQNKGIWLPAEDTTTRETVNTIREIIARDKQVPFLPKPKRVN